MAQITINIPNQKVDLVLEAFCTSFNYQEFVIDENGDTIPNPVSKSEFSKGVLINFIKDTVKSYKIRVDSQTVIDNSTNTSDSLGLS